MSIQANGCVMMHATVQGMPDLPQELGYTPFEDPEPDWWGIQTDKHITLKYGLVNELVSIKDVENVLTTPRLVRHKPISIGSDRLKLSVFNGDEESRAIVLRINSSWLHQAHTRLSRLPHVDTYPVYQPHLCLGYVLTKDVIEALELCRPHLQNTEVQFGEFFTSELQ